MEKLITILDKFLNKKFTPTIISVVLALLTYYFTPSDNPALLKLTFWGYLILAFGLWFLFLELIAWIKRKIDHHKIISANETLNEKEKNIEIERARKNLWKSIDDLSDADYNMLIQFIKSENQPVTKSKTDLLLYGRGLLTSNWVHEREVSPMTMQAFINPHDEKHQFILTKEIYDAIKQSYEDHGKISNFPR